MKLSELKNHLQTLESLNFVQPNGYFVPKHFHITEVGLITKHFIDCGSTVRNTKVANIQIWVAQDVDHRLTPKGLLNILEISNTILGDEDLEIEIEYQTETVGKYGLGFKDENFVLVPTKTDCLAAEHCGIPTEKKKLQLVELGINKEECCTPGGGCC
ncbi:MAG: DUF6428 family protein [Bacteroidia bacterium]